MDEQKREEFLRQTLLYVDICRAAGLYGAEHVADIVEMAARRADSDDPKDKPDAPAGDDEDGEEDDDGEAEAGEGDAEPLSEAAQKVAAGIKELKPRRGRPPKSALDGADAPSGTRVQ